MTSSECLAVPDVKAAPLWPAGGVYPVVKVDAAPPMDRPDDPAWQRAAPLGPLCEGGKPGAAERATDARMLLHDGTLYVRARCLDPDPKQIKHGTKRAEVFQDDAIELVMGAAPGRVHPLLQIAVNAGGVLSVERSLRPASVWGNVPIERPDPAQVGVRSGIDNKGWWVTLAIPLAKLGLSSQGFAFNFMRDFARDKTHPAWVDGFGGRFQRPWRMGEVRFVDALAAHRPALPLPAGLALGDNPVRLVDWAKGFKLLLDGQPVAVADDGAARLVFDMQGHHELVIADAAGTVVRRYGVEVRRPLLVEAAQPAVAELASPVGVKVSLNVAAAKVPVTVRLTSGGKPVGEKQLTLGSGTHEVSVAHTMKAPGEVMIEAHAEVPAGGKTLALEAQHWCLVGEDLAKHDRWRDGIDKLDPKARLRAGIIDAADWFRRLQTGDGIYVGRAGQKQANEWNRSFVLVAALAYKVDWPENPHRGDRRFLESAALGLDRECDPTLWQHFQTFPPNRDLQPALLAYELLKDDVSPRRAAYWKSALMGIVTSEVETWEVPAMDQLAFHSEQTGTGTNHWAYHTANVSTAGRIFGRDDWKDLARTLMRRLAHHAQDGQFPERRDVPASTYTWLTMNALGEYYRQSGDESVLPTLLACSRYATNMTLPDFSLIRLHDGRVNWRGGGECGQYVVQLTPEGRELVDRWVAEAVNPERTPGRYRGLEHWFRMAEDALYWTDGERKALPADTEFDFLDGRGVVARRSGHIYALSAICVPPTEGLFRLDPQNAVEWHHAKAGSILKGNNSQGQPEAGSFMRKPADGRTVYLPTDGIIQRIDRGHAATLTFDTFKTQVLAQVLDANHGRVKVELLEATGDEPVIFSFFPGVEGRETAELSPDGRTLKFRNVTLTLSAPVKTANIQLYNPYNGRYGVRTKPLRAWVELKKHAPFVIDIAVGEQE